MSPPSPWSVLVVQAGVPRPQLDRRTRVVLAGGRPGRSRVHLAYVALEGVGVVLLTGIGR